MLAYIDGVLDIASAAELEAHLRACPACAREADELRATALRLASLLGSTAAPAGLVESCLLRMEGVAFRAGTRKALVPRFRPLRAVALAAASLVLAIAGLSLIAPPAYAMVVSNVVRISAQATAIAADRIPAWGHLLRALDGLRAILGL